jgi:hypothetical protein
LQDLVGLGKTRSGNKFLRARARPKYHGGHLGRKAKEIAMYEFIQQVIAEEATAEAVVGVGT